MGSCKDCKHYRFGYCEGMAVSYDGDTRFPGTIMVEVDVLDDSGLKVDIRTDPDFGCKLFEAR